MTTELNLHEYYKLSGLNARTFPELTSNPEEFREAIVELHYTHAVSAEEVEKVKEYAMQIKQDLIAINLRAKLPIPVPDNEFCCSQDEIVYIVKLYNVLKRIKAFRVFDKKERYCMLIYLMYALNYNYSNRVYNASDVNNILFRDPYFIRERYKKRAIRFIINLVASNLNFDTINLGTLIMREIISGNLGNPITRELESDELGETVVVQPVEHFTSHAFHTATASLLASDEELESDEESEPTYPSDDDPSDDGIDDYLARSRLGATLGGNSKIGPNREAIKLYKRKSRRVRKSKTKKLRTKKLRTKKFRTKKSRF